ncbi:MAG: hypothetical protein ACYTG0_01690 [Planctomycetota bacterium]|jgi:hypothetical protein
MRYGITRLVLGDHQFLEMPEDQYSQLTDARRNVFESLYIEEKFAYLIENYRELEIEALANTVHNATMPSRPWSELVSYTHLFNRRIINLLTTCRLYIDHTPHHLNSIFGDDNPATRQFTEGLSSRYDSSLAYRLLEALRNYVQHRGLPLAGLRRNSRRTEPGDPNAQLVLTIQFDLDTRLLIADPKFKRSVATELEQRQSRMDVRPMIREYIGLIAQVHRELRQEIDSPFATWAAAVEDAMQQYSQGDPQLELALAAVKEGDNGKILERNHLDREPAKRRAEMVSVYSHLASVSHQVITSATE